jgi:hypothetical protein
MSAIQAGKLIVAGQYDFKMDSTSGAVGTIDLQIPLQSFSKIIRVIACTTTLFTSGGAAKISFGLLQTGVNSPQSTPLAFFQANGFAFYNQVDANSNFAALASQRDFNANPQKLYTDYTVIMAISGAAITAGAIQLEVHTSVMNF